MAKVALAVLGILCLIVGNVEGQGGAENSTSSSTTTTATPSIPGVSERPDIGKIPADVLSKIPLLIDMCSGTKGCGANDTTWPNCTYSIMLILETALKEINAEAGTGTIIKLTLEKGIDRNMLCEFYKAPPVTDSPTPESAQSSSTTSAPVTTSIPSGTTAEPSSTTSTQSPKEESNASDSSGGYLGWIIGLSVTAAVLICGALAFGVHRYTKRAGWIQW